MNPSLLYVARRLVNYYNSQSECVYTKAMPRWAFRQRELCGTTTQGSSWCERVAAGFKVKGKGKRWSPVWRLIKHTSDTQRCTLLRPVVQLSLAEQNNIKCHEVFYLWRELEHISVVKPVCSQTALCHAERWARTKQYGFSISYEGDISETARSLRLCSSN